MSLTAELERALLFEMLKIRGFEEAIAQRYHEGKMRCPTHLSIGQEAVPAAIAKVLRKTDLAVSTHRGHAHYLAKGGDPAKMIAELYGRVTGCARGKGGSMHLIDLSVGFKGTTAIVGNTIPIGVGLGLALQMDQLRGERKEDIALVFLGDAAVEEGVFFESANFAVLRKLPVLFVCENNFFSVYSPLKVRQPMHRKIHEFVRAIGMPAFDGDGNDVVQCHQMLEKACAQLRQPNSGPMFLEFYTYRWREHCGPNFDNDLGYRDVAEFEEWKRRDPVEMQKIRLLTKGWIDDSGFAQMQNEIQGLITHAFDFAERSPFPEKEEAFMHLYSEVPRA